MKSKQIPIRQWPLALMLMVFFSGGCVERIIQVHSNPAGAVVWLNGTEVGTTPVETPFTWYGDYEVVLRKDGFETVNTSRRTPVPWYQWLGVDLLCETIVPVNFVDRHEWEFELRQEVQTDMSALGERAEAMRAESIEEEEGAAAF